MLFQALQIQHELYIFFAVEETGCVEQVGFADVDVGKEQCDAFGAV